MIKGLLSLRVSCQLYNGLRGMATTVDKALLSKLRKRTGISFINCKKALEQFENDLEKAEKWLKEQAQKEGWAKATKLQNRSMSSGLVAIISNNQAATMIEVNCETDFVARNNKFVNLTSSLAQHCHQALLQRPESVMMLDKAVVGSLAASDGKSLADHVALEVGSIGENMALRRAVHLKGGESILSAYVHVSGPEIKTDSACHLGKYGVILSLNQQAQQQQPEAEEDGSFPLDELSHLLGQHIVGMNPKLVGCMEDDAEVETKSDEAEETENEAANKKKEDEERLVCQEFLLDPNVSVGELLKKNGVVVNAFYRFACGEELPQEGED